MGRGNCKAGTPVVRIRSFATTCVWMVVLVSLVIRSSASCYDGKQKVQFTKYWIAKQGSDDEDENGRLIHLAGPATETLVDASGRVLAKVDSNTKYKCLLEGTCLLEDDRLLNVGERDDVFEVVNRRRFPFGQGVDANPLGPFVSVASNDLPLFTTLFVPALKGRKLPNGKIHNGCVRVDDKLSEHTGCHLDFLVFSYDFYTTFGLSLPENTPADATSDCLPLHYYS